MKNICLLKSFLVLFFLSPVHNFLISQECSVEQEALKGTYTGDCKKGKAHGKGKAVGTDTYEGDFKSGLPDGEGVYTWSNGNSYKGSFEKGLKDGHGILNIKSPDRPDSLLEGYWKKDIYKGIYPYAYKVLSKTKKVTHVDIKTTTKKEHDNQISIIISNTMGGAGTFSNPQLSPLKVSNIVLKSGGYGRTYENTNYASKSELILYEVWFPLKMQIVAGTESIELELYEDNSYIIDITVNQ